MKEEIINFFNKYGVVFLLLIPIFLSVFFRMYPAYLPITDEWSENQVHRFYKQQIKQDVYSKYPNLPPVQFNNLVEKELKLYLKNNKELINQQILDSSNQLKSKFKDKNDNTYLLAIDPYTFYRQTENIVETGYHYDELKNGVPWNNHIVAPIGKPMKEKPDAHVQFQYYMYKVVSFFNKDVSLLAVIFYAPIIISMLSVIPAFLITRKIAGNFGGFIAGLIVAIHPVFLSRTPGGFADTDAYNVFFPLFILLFCVNAFYSKDASKVIWATVCSFMIGLYSMFWTNWLIFDMIMLSIIAYIIYILVLNYKINILKVLKSNPIKYAALVFSILLILSPLFTYAFTQQNLIQIGIFSPLRIANTFKDASKADYWPNVYTTVAELNEVNYKQVISQIGFGGGSNGKIFFLFALIGIILALTNHKHNWLALLLTIWFLGTIYGSTKGVRFILLLVPAFAIAVGACFGIAYKSLTKLLEKHLSVEENISKCLILIFFILFMFVPIGQAHSIAKQEIPSMNDAWFNTLTEIKDRSSTNAIITSWWDFGHWFKAVADRPVTFDGGSQNNPMAHWVGKALLTDNEKLSIGILRMLDCSSDKVVHYIQNNITNEDIDDTIKLINNVIVLNYTTAYNYMDKQNINDIHKNNILKMTHCTPPEGFLITSGDMVMKSGVWAHFGSWDFEKAQLWQNVKGMDFTKGVNYIMKNFSKTEKYSEELYYKIQSLEEGREANTWIAPWPSYMSKEENCNRKNGLINCNNGLVINMTGSSAYVNTQQGLQSIKSIGFVDNNSIFKIRTFEDGQLDVAAIITPSGKSILMQPELVGSMFTRLFFMNSIGLKHFEKFSDKTSVSGDRLLVWEINWDGQIE